MDYKSRLEAELEEANKSCITCIHWRGDRCRYNDERVDGLTCDKYYPKDK